MLHKSLVVIKISTRRWSWHIQGIQFCKPILLWISNSLWTMHLCADHKWFSQRYICYVIKDMFFLISEITYWIICKRSKILQQCMKDKDNMDQYLVYVETNNKHNKSIITFHPCPPPFKPFPHISFLFNTIGVKKKERKTKNKKPWIPSFNYNLNPHSSRRCHMLGRQSRSSTRWSMWGA